MTRVTHAAAAAGLLALVPTFAHAASVSITSAHRGVSASQPRYPDSDGDFTNDLGPWDQTASTSLISSSHTSTITEDLFDVTATLTSTVAPGVPPGSLGFASVSVQFDVLTTTSFRWTIDQLDFIGTTDDGSLTTFSVTQHGVGTPFAIYRDWIGGNPPPDPIYGETGVVVLAPGSYELYMEIFASSEGQADGTLTQAASFREIPAPGALALLGLAGLGASRGRRR